MGTKPLVCFVWQGVSDSDVWNNWDDGLAAAMRIVDQYYDVEYKEPWDELNGDKILYWEAPCTAQGKNAQYYDAVRFAPQWKALLFAGGPVEHKNLEGFDHVFYESDHNAEDFGNIPATKAFGVNTEIFRPEKRNKDFDAIMHGTFAGWKRQGLFGEAFGERGLAVGKFQENDPSPYHECKKHGTKIMSPQSRSVLNTLINRSKVCVNTSDYWGGGQRTTLEAMACGVPVIVMEDSPKNREYVEESGVGAVCKPEPESIREAWETVESQPEKSVAFVHSKYTPWHYAKAIMSVL